MESDGRNTNILVVEDSPEDYETLVRAFRVAGLKNTVYHCGTGDEALDYLYRRGAYADGQSAPAPGLILLDLNLPGTDGREVLKEIKSDPELRSIPVIVLTTSRDERDIQDCYAAGANTYVQKPVDLQGFVDAATRLKDYWLEIAILPKTDLL